MMPSTRVKPPLFLEDEELEAVVLAEWVGVLPAEVELELAAVGLAD